MIGQTISHYRVIEKLGGGGMGVVYKALDVRLDRFVALKFLPPHLTQNHDANQRFFQEARAASALDHPNICTIHEVDETPDGDVFLTMAFYEGETLKHRIQRGQLPVSDAIDYTVQVLRGLAKAHQSGFVHRDIKPANLMVTADGAVKILDFGLAKLVGFSDLTQTGVTMGTATYMAPEQLLGRAVDARADLWATGVVLYEMLAGRRAFDGDGIVPITAILNASPEPLSVLRRDVSADLERVVRKALEKDPGARYQSSADFLAALEGCRTPSSRRPLHRALSLLRRPVVAVPALLLLLAAIAGVGLQTRQWLNVRRARNQLLPEVRRLIATEDFSTAFRNTEEAERYVPGEPVLQELWPQVSQRGAFITQPPGAQVSMQEYSATGDVWKTIGTTPLENVRLPRGALRFRLIKDGYETAILARPNPGAFLFPREFRFAINIPLIPKGTAPEMVSVPGGTGTVTLTGFNFVKPATLGSFLIDRHEVTNREFKRFVDAGGYAGALRAFRDSTERAGPATWELGQYLAGQDDYPVGGVSWYEAAAYCKSEGKELPTIFHWARAAMPAGEAAFALAPAIIPLSNFSRSSVARVETYRGIGPYGTFDMAGNVREWGLNEASGGRKWVLGGAWNEPDYLFTIGNSLPPSDRSSTNGVRCVRYSVPQDATGPLSRAEPLSTDPRTAKPVSDEVFAVYKSQYSLVKSPLNAKLESRDLTNPDWVREKLSLDAGYNGERLAAYLFLPRNASPPYQVAVYFPPVGGPFTSRSSSERLGPGLYDYVVRSGRALLWPVYKGSFERWDPLLTLTGDEYVRGFRGRIFEWRQDLGRAIDVLGTRKDLDVTRLFYLGYSFGSSTAFPVMALEERLKTAVLEAPGLYGVTVGLPPEADAINYAPRVRIPVLMIGGRQDFLFPLETSQIPLFNWLGTPAADKKHVVFDGGHGQFPRSATIREVLSWLDKYLGPVETRH